MSSAREGAQKRQGKMRPLKDAAALGTSQRQEDEANAIPFSVAGVGGVAGVPGSSAYEDAQPEAEPESPYWATWSLTG